MLRKKVDIQDVLEAELKERDRQHSARLQDLNNTLSRLKKQLAHEELAAVAARASLKKAQADSGAALKLLEENLETAHDQVRLPCSPGLQTLDAFFAGMLKS